VANKAKDIAGMVVGREMIFPKNMRDQFFTFLCRCIDACEQAYKAINELDKLSEVGFSGKEVAIINSLIDTLFQIEKDTDRIEIQLRKILFEMEAILPAVNVIFLILIAQ